MRRVAIWSMATLLCVSMTVGCKKSETCENYVLKSASCSEKKLDPVKLAKMKAFVVAICLAEKEDKDLGVFAKQEIACIHKASCEEFKECTKGVRKLSRMVRRRIRLRKSIDKIKKLEEKQDWYKAQRRCSNSYSAKKLMESEDEKDKAVAKAYYDFCLNAIPGWLGKLRDGGTEKSYFSACSSKRFYKASGATPAQQKAIDAICGELKVLGVVNGLKKEAPKHIAKKSMPWRCRQKEAAKLEALTSENGKKLFAQFKAICYQQIGIVVLQSEKEKLMKKSRRMRRYCPYTAKKIVAAFRKWENLAKPENKELLDFFFKICK